MGTKGTDPGELSRAIARVIDDSLRKAGVSRARAAEVAGLSQPRTNRVLSGARPMYVDELGDFSQILNRSAASIVRQAEDSIRDHSVASDPITYAEQAEAKLAQLLQSNYTAAAKHHESDPYANLGEENQEPAT